MDKKPIRTEIDFDGNKVNIYDDHKETHKTGFWWNEIIEISKSGGWFGPDEKIAVDHVEHHPFGTATHNIRHVDETSSKTFHDPHIFIWPNDVTTRPGKQTNESYRESVVNHQKELSANLDHKRKLSKEYSNASSNYDLEVSSISGTTTIASKSTSNLKGDGITGKKTWRGEMSVIIIEGDNKLQDIIRNHPDLKVRKQYTASMQNQNMLFGIIQWHPDLEVREIAINNFTNLKQLTLIAKYSPDTNIRNIAMRKTSFTNKLKIKIENIIIDIINAINSD